MGIPEIPPVGSAIPTTSTRSELFPGSRGIKKALRNTGDTVHGSLFLSSKACWLRWDGWDALNDEYMAIRTGSMDMGGLLRSCLIRMYGALGTRTSTDIRIQYEPIIATIISVPAGLLR